MTHRAGEALVIKDLVGDDQVLFQCIDFILISVHFVWFLLPGLF
jgi:hypothetical protein